MKAHGAAAYRAPEVDERDRAIEPPFGRTALWPGPRARDRATGRPPRLGTARRALGEDAAPAPEGGGSGGRSECQNPPQTDSPAGRARSWAF